MQTKSGAICASPVVSESWLEQIAPPAIVGWSDVPCAAKATLVLYLFLVAVRARSLTRLHNGAADGEWPTLHAAGARREHPHSHAGSRGSTLWLVRLVFAFPPRSRLIHTSRLAAPDSCWDDPESRYYLRDGMLLVGLLWLDRALRRCRPGWSLSKRHVFVLLMGIMSQAQQPGRPTAPHVSLPAPSSKSRRC